MKIHKAKAPLVKKPTMKSLLSPKEIEVVTMMAGGLENKEIADELYRSVATVQQHIRAVHHKLGLTSTGGRKVSVLLTKRALREGLIDLDERVA